MSGEAKSRPSIRALMLPLQDDHLLIPHSVVQEIILYREPEPVPDVPDWVLGEVDWRSWRLPVASAERLRGRTYKAVERKAHIAVCNLLSGDDRFPCVGIVTQGVPQLIRVDAAGLIPASKVDSPWVLENLYYRNEEAWIPDLRALGREIAGLLT